MADTDVYCYKVTEDAGASPSKLREDFDKDGFVVLPAFASPEEAKGMKARMTELIEAWDPAESKGSVFETYGNKKSLNQEYFLDSASTTKFFLEAGAVDKETGDIKSDIPKADIVNKVGHAMHFLDPVFTAYAQSEKVKQLVQSLGYTDPVLPQSMYIFKQPRIGGEVTSHQDSTFLFTTPRQTCLALWLALDDATLQNGCIWARRGSHKEPLRSYFERVYDQSDQMQLLNRPIANNGDPSPTSPGNLAREWENHVPGKNPDYCPETAEALQKVGFEAVPVKAGDLICFAGTLDHLSLSNKTDAARHTFQLHLVEGPGAGVTWGKGNWMQYPEGLSFPSLRLNA